MTEPYECIYDYADKHKAKVLLDIDPNDGHCVVVLKGDTEERGEGSCPRDAYCDLAAKLQLEVT